MKKGIVLFIATLTFFAGCVEDVNLNVVGGEPKIVIEGKIESGKPAEVFVMRSNSVSSTKDYQDFYFVADAIVTITDGTTTETLTPTYDPINPLNSIVDLEATYFTPYKGSTIIGTPGKTYKITVVAIPNPDNNIKKTYTASTTIPTPILLESVWWKSADNLDTLGYAWARFTEPAGTGNAYKWYAKRSNNFYQKGINIDSSCYRYDPTNPKIDSICRRNELKDRRYLSPLGSTFDDKFIDGKSLDIFFNRGLDPSDAFTQDKLASNNNTSLFYYFKKTDTIFIKFTTIDQNTLKFFTTYEAAYQSNGNPFASPVNIISNIEGGGLGIWAGYGVTYDTIYPTP